MPLWLALAVVLGLLLVLLHWRARPEGFASPEARLRAGREAQALFEEEGGEPTYAQFRRRLPGGDPVHFQDLRRLARTGRLTAAAAAAALAG